MIKLSRPVYTLMLSFLVFPKITQAIYIQAKCKKFILPVDSDTVDPQAKGYMEPSNREKNK